MRKATIPLITLTVGIGIGIFTDRALFKLSERQSHNVETESWRTFEMEIDGQKRVVNLLTDTSDSLRINPK